jgi:UDP:flavonoid glycosyltransferase YjiC (YdhE family)
MGHDQPDNAARLERLGAAASLAPKEFKAAKVAALLGQLREDDRVAAACRAAAQKCREARPAEIVVKTLDEVR